MSNGTIRLPERGQQLLKNLFTDRDYNATLEVISAGLTAILSNSKRLTQDVTLLANSKRYASAAFLLATANEEIAKSYILIDMCRLDFLRHHSVLKALCQAFYSHVAKYAYNEVLRLIKILNPADMNEVKQLWDDEVTRWWPSGVESGEPDMPHETYFTRELRLYVDFSDFDQKWLAPEVDTGKFVFEESAGPGGISQTRETLNRLHRTSEAGLYRPECLSILNETFRKHYINEKIGGNEIARLAETVAERIETELGIAREAFWQSTLNEWPLYHFVSKRV